MKTVLQTLRENSLSANPSKTELAMEEIEYLGFRVSQEGVKVSERKLKIIRQLPPPQTEKVCFVCVACSSYLKDSSINIHKIRIISGNYCEKRQFLIGL